MSRDKVSLSHLVNTFMQLHTEDSILSPTLKRNKVLLVMRRGIRLFSRSVGGALKAVQIKLESNLYVPYPADYLNYIRVSVLTDDNYLVPIKYNEQIPTAYAQLYSPIPNQDGNFDKLLDPNGIELLSSTPAAIPNFQNEFTDEDFFWFLYNNFPYQMYGNETGNNVWGEFKDDVPNSRCIVTLCKI